MNCHSTDRGYPAFQPKRTRAYLKGTHYWTLDNLCHFQSTAINDFRLKLYLTMIGPMHELYVIFT